MQIRWPVVVGIIVALTIVRLASGLDRSPPPQPPRSLLQEGWHREQQRTLGDAVGRFSLMADHCPQLAVDLKVLNSRAQSAGIDANASPDWFEHGRLTGKSAAERMLAEEGSGCYCAALAYAHAAGGSYIIVREFLLVAREPVSEPSQDCSYIVPILYSVGEHVGFIDGVDRHCRELEVSPDRLQSLFRHQGIAFAKGRTAGEAEGERIVRTSGAAAYCKATLQRYGPAGWRIAGLVRLR